MSALEVTDWTDPMAAGRIVIENALLEDNAVDDEATGALGDHGEIKVTCSVNAREDLVLAGLPVASMVFSMLPGGVEVVSLTGEGERVSAGDAIATITGSAAWVLRGERVFLNILGRMSGIATLTRMYVDLCRGTGVQILDTRKTTPGLRALEKYAVRTGGGENHRFSLTDMAMLKDNHLAAIGGVENLAPVMNRLRSRGIPVEIEVDNMTQFQTVLSLKPDRILLDNMTLEELRSAVSQAHGSGIYLEASGGISEKTIKSVAQTGVHGISSGALTHSARSVDIGLDWVYHRSEDDKTSD